MPIVHVRGPSDPGDDLEDVLGTIAIAVADATDDDPGDVWCTFVKLDAETIGERSVGHGSGAIVYVDVLMRDRDPERLGAALEAAAESVASSWDVPVEDVWARYEPVRSGEIFAGGRLLRW
jgi:hypothetical protein